MKQLRADAINWPDGIMYFVEQEEWCPHMYFSIDEFLKKYSIDLLNILNTVGTYSSPTQPKEQLELDFK